MSLIPSSKTYLQATFATFRYSVGYRFWTLIGGSLNWLLDHISDYTAFGSTINNFFVTNTGITSFTTVSTLNFTSTGKPLVILLNPDYGSNPSVLHLSEGTTAIGTVTPVGAVRLKLDGSVIAL